jgi:hypothetical protein
MNPNLTVRDRAGFYAKAFPNYPPLRADDRWLDGMWVLGNNYKGSGYYGAYPPGYLKRMAALFPDATQILHACSGSLKAGRYTRVDRLPSSPSRRLGYVQGDVENLLEIFPTRRFDLAYIDPPYSAHHAKRYNCKMVNRKKVIESLHDVVMPGGHLVWLDTKFPMFRKTQWHWYGIIGIVRSTNHDVRAAFMFVRQ